MYLDWSCMSRRVTKVNQSDRRLTRVRLCMHVRGSGHGGRAAWLWQSCGSGQRKLHVRLSVTSLHLVFPFFQHCGLKRFIWNFGYLHWLWSLSGKDLKLMYKFTLTSDNHVFVFIDNLIWKHAHRSKDIINSIRVKTKGIKLKRLPWTLDAFQIS